MQLFIVLLISFVLITGCQTGIRTDSGEIPDKKTIPAGQPELQRQKDSLAGLLRNMKAEKLDCNATAYWEIIREGEKTIPLLLECLTDTRPTGIFNACKNGKLNVGEVCYFALEELADFPAFLVTQTQYDLIENDCWNFYTYLFNDKNKSEYQKKARNFYFANRNTNYQFTKYKKEEMTTCRKVFKIEGRLSFKQTSN